MKTLCAISFSMIIIRVNLNVILLEITQNRIILNAISERSINFDLFVVCKDDAIFFCDLSYSLLFLVKHIVPLAARDAVMQMINSPKK